MLFFFVFSVAEAGTTTQLFAFKRIIQSMFCHLNIEHLIANMTALLTITGPASRVMSDAGASGLTVFFAYLWCGITGTFLSLYWRFTQMSNALSVGASGAIMGFYSIIASLDDGRYRWIPGLNVSSSTLPFVYLFIDFLRATYGGESIDVAAHVGGVVGGYLFTRFILRHTSDNRDERYSRSRVYGMNGRVRNW